MAKNLKKEEEDTFYTEDRDQPIPPENVVAYNELRSCADLHRMHASGKLEIQPDFQREVVWKGEEQARFIDSLVKQLPIPSMCFSLDHQTQKWKVIDGLQRMFTITSFLGAKDWRVADAGDIHPLLKGKLNSKLREGTDDEKRLYSSVEDISIPITVIRCSYDNAGHMRYLFTIFNRLNSGGVRLNNQEIRNCIYSGPFNDLLKRFDANNPDWLRVKRRVWGKTDRFRGVEILLRALAFSQKLTSYEGNLAGFLNDFMLACSKSATTQLQQIEADLTVMAHSAAAVLEALGPGKRSLTFIEGVLVGVLSNADNVRHVEQSKLKDWATRKATQLSASNAEPPRYALSNAQTVRDRLKQAMVVFLD